MIDSKLKFLELVQDSRRFIQNLLEPQCVPKKESKKQESILFAPESKKPSNEVPQSVAAKVESKIEPEQKLRKSSWDLVSMAQVEESDFLRKKIQPYTPTIKLEIAALLVLPEENSTHRLFLESVSRAITRCFRPATVAIYHELLFKRPPCRIILTPYALLRKKIAHAKPHQIVDTEQFLALPLLDLDNYAHDTDCKRALWKSIQLLFQS